MGDVSSGTKAFWKITPNTVIGSEYFGLIRVVAY